MFYLGYARIQVLFFNRKVFYHLANYVNLTPMVHKNGEKWPLDKLSAWCLKNLINRRLVLCIAYFLFVPSIGVHN